MGRDWESANTAWRKFAALLENNNLIVHRTDRSPAELSFAPRSCLARPCSRAVLRFAGGAARHERGGPLHMLGAPSGGSAVADRRPRQDLALTADLLPAPCSPCPRLARLHRLHRLPQACCSRRVASHPRAARRGLERDDQVPDDDAEQLGVVHPPAAKAERRSKERVGGDGRGASFLSPL